MKFYIRNCPECQYPVLGVKVGLHITGDCDCQMHVDGRVVHVSGFAKEWYEIQLKAPDYEKKPVTNTNYICGAVPAIAKERVVDRVHQDILSDLETEINSWDEFKMASNMLTFHHGVKIGMCRARDIIAKRICSYPENLSKTQRRQ